MPPTIVQSFSPTAVKIRFGETYVSDGLNAKVAGVIPRGIYRGFRLSTNVAPLTVQLEPDASLLHLAVYETLTGRSLTLRVSGGPIPIPLAAFAGTRVYVAVFAEYAVGSPTAAELRVYSVADYNGAAEKEELVVLGTVDVPGAGVIPASAVSLAESTLPWKNAVVTRPWKQVVKNGGFEDGTGSSSGSPTGSQFAPGFSGEEANSGAVAALPASFGPVHSGGFALQVSLPLTTSLVRFGPGEFVIADPLSGDVIPVRAGQLVDVSLWLAGVTVQAYTAVTNGLRLVLEFYDSTHPVPLLQSTEQIASDPTVHIGTFAYSEIAGVFTAPADGYFRWYLDGTVDLAAGASEFWVDDIRIYLEPAADASDADPESTRVAAVATTRLDILDPNQSSRQIQNQQAARLTMRGGTIALTKSGQSSETSVPPWSTPHLYENVDQDFGQTAVGISGTASTADQDTVPHQYKLLHSYRSSQTDQSRVRVYSRTIDNEYVITSNARWGGGASQAWFPDVAALDATKFTMGVSGPRWESKDGILPVSWLDSAWDGTVGAGTGLIQLLFAATVAVDQNDASSPLITTSKVAADHPGFPFNFFKILAAFPTGMSGIYARVYSCDGAGSAIGNFVVVLNAEWNPATGLWTADDIGHPALRYSVVVNPAGSYFSVDSKAVTAVPWGENPGGIWDVSPVSGFGHYKSIGQYDWILSRTHTYLIPIQDGVPSGTDEWEFDAANMQWERSAATFNALAFPLPVNQDDVLTRVRVIGEENAAVTLAFVIGFVSGYNFTTPPGVIAFTTLDSDSSPGTGVDFTVTLTTSSTIDKTTRVYYLQILSTTVGDRIRAVEVRVTSPGLRAF